MAAILEIEKPVFRASHIAQKTELGRSLIFYHLKTMCGERILEKDGKFYRVIDKAEMIRSITNQGQNTVEMRKPPNELRFLTNLEELNNYLDMIVALRFLKINGYSAIIDQANEDFDEAIDCLKSAKKYLNNKQFGKTGALDAFEPFLTFKEVGNHFKPILEKEGIDHKTFSSELEGAYNELRDGYK